MHAWWQRRRYTVYAAALGLIGFCALLINGRLWGLWGVQHMRPHYLDLVAVLAAGEAATQGIDVYAGNPLDPFGRPHVYGPAWLLTGRLGLVTEDAGWLGSLLAVAFLGTAAALIAPRTRGALALTVLVLLSPPVVLGLERGNNDLVVFLLLAFTAVFAAAPPRAGLWAGAGATVLAAALKFYPLAGLVALAGGRASLRRSAMVAAFAVAAFALLWWVQRHDLARVLELTPKPATIFAHGLSVSVITWDLLAAVRGWLLLGALPVGAVGLWWGIRHARDLAVLAPLHGRATAALLAGVAAWGACFVLTSSFPYRAVLLLLAFPALLAAGAPAAGRHLAVATLFTFWLAAPKYWFAHAAEGDPTDARSLHLLSVVTGAEQAAFLLLTAALGGIVLGWAWRRLRAAPEAT